MDLKELPHEVLYWRKLKEILTMTSGKKFKQKCLMQRIWRDKLIRWAKNGIVSGAQTKRSDKIKKATMLVPNCSKPKQMERHIKDMENY